MLLWETPGYHLSHQETNFEKKSFWAYYHFLIVNQSEVSGVGGGGGELVRYQSSLLGISEFPGDV